jgi:hypothetical protein
MNFLFLYPESHFGSEFCQYVSLIIKAVILCNKVQNASGVENPTAEAGQSSKKAKSVLSSPMMCKGSGTDKLKVGDEEFNSLTTQNRWDLWTET